MIPEAVCIFNSLGTITQIDEVERILCDGFPCRPYSTIHLAASLAAHRYFAEKARANGAPVDA
jgi:hypothetical protein